MLHVGDELHHSGWADPKVRVACMHRLASDMSGSAEYPDPTAACHAVWHLCSMPRTFENVSHLCDVIIIPEKTAMDSLHVESVVWSTCVSYKLSYCTLLAQVGTHAAAVMGILQRLEAC